MTKVIETSITDGTVNISTAFGVVQFQVVKGWRVPRTYTATDIADVHAVSEETFRHGGKAVAGAVIGGVLTGGIGLLAGAAIGGRRRKEGIYIVTFTDGHHIVIETHNKKLLAIFQPILMRKEVASRQPTPIPTAGPISRRLNR